MTAEEAIKYFKNNNERIRSIAIDENRTSKFMKETIDANSIAIKNIEAWEKVKEEIKNAKPVYPDRVRIWSTDTILAIINKHLKEVENEH